MAQNLEKNKIFAAVLIALLLALVTCLVADFLVQPEQLSKNVYVIEVPEGGASGSAPVVIEEESIEDLMATASVEKGKEVARKCVQCHSFEENGPHRIGPRLWGIFGKDQASHSDYPYSAAAKKKEGNWDLLALDAFLKKPKDYMPGTKMSFAGLRKPEDIADVMLYLKENS